MKALLFPGQGVQKIGMLDEIINSNKEVVDYLSSASKNLDFDLIELISSGPEEKLNLTEFAQPAILATSIAIAKIKNINSEISVTAGLSLGEYSALVFANCLEFSDALKLVNVRGQLMQSAVPEGTAGMLVVLNMELADVYKMIEKVNTMFKKIDYWRWFGFFLAVIGAYVLGNAKVSSQSIGWIICSFSCLIWIIMGIKDKDIPRTLMEVMYFVIGIRATINWLDFS